MRGDDRHGEHPEENEGPDGSGAVGDPGRAQRPATPTRRAGATAAPRRRAPARQPAPELFQRRTAAAGRRPRRDDSYDDEVARPRTPARCAAPPTTTASRSARSCAPLQRRPCAHVLSGRKRLRRGLGSGRHRARLAVSARICRPRSARAASPRPCWPCSAAIFFAPIVFFFVLAHMVWRSQECA